MTTAPTTPTKKPTSPKTPTPNIPKFADWAAGRSGFSQAELQEVYALTFGLTPEAIKDLENKTGIKSSTTLTPAAAKKPGVPPQVLTRPAPDLLITRTPYPKWWKDSLNASINLTAPGSQTLATVSGNLLLYVATIVITVTAATVIKIHFGNAGSSGPVHLGDTNQPMGMVVAMGNSPAPCGSGPLSISATDPNNETPSIGGWATCFVEKEK
jgi:hypothetical protein